MPWKTKLMIVIHTLSIKHTGYPPIRDTATSTISTTLSTGSSGTPRKTDVSSLDQVSDSESDSSSWRVRVMFCRKKSIRHYAGKLGDVSKENSEKHEWYKFYCPHIR